MYVKIITHCFLICFIYGLLRMTKHLISNLKLIEITIFTHKNINADYLVPIKDRKKPYITKTVDNLISHTSFPSDRKSDNSFE